MEGREYLKEIRESNKTLEILKQQIQIEEARLTDISVHYKDIQVQTSGSGNMMWEKVPVDRSGLSWALKRETEKARLSRKNCGSRICWKSAGNITSLFL